MLHSHGLDFSFPRIALRFRDRFDAYVQQQFNQFDKDFSGDLDFDEFLGFYSVIIFEQKKQGFSFSKWQKHNTPR